MSALLEIQGLCVDFQLAEKVIRVVDNVDLRIQQGEVVGLIGESGSGKSVTCSSVLRLLPDNASVEADVLRFKGSNCRELSNKAFGGLRGREMAMIFQDPAAAFNPVKTIGWHFRHVSHRAARDQPEFKRRGAWKSAAINVLRRVGIPHGAHALSSYPHQLSGGMLQRALIGLVLQFRPSLIVADEPTTNLDNIVEHQIIDLFRSLKQETEASFVFITHDMTVAARICNRIVVMYAGEVIETGEARDLFNNPRHPYTQGLLQTATGLEQRAQRLAEIPGGLPDWNKMPPGCRFEPRCPYSRNGCTKPQSMRRLHGGREVRCLLVDAND